MDKYEILRNRIENMVNEIDLAIINMQSDVNNRDDISKDISKANEQLSDNVDDLISRVSVIEMISISNELKQILSE